MSISPGKAAPRLFPWSIIWPRYNALYSASTPDVCSRCGVEVWVMISFLLWYISFCVIIWLVVAVLLRPEVLMILGGILFLFVLWVLCSVSAAP